MKVLVTLFKYTIFFALDNVVDHILNTCKCASDEKLKQNPISCSNRKSESVMLKIKVVSVS